MNKRRTMKEMPDAKSQAQVSQPDIERARK